MSNEQTLGPAAYARWRATTLGHITEDLEVALVFALAGDLAAKRVLDVGTGDGTYAVSAAERGALVTGVDCSSEMLVAARSRADAHGVTVDLRQGSVEQLPFADGAFDAVIAVTVLCFVEDPRRAVAEIARVLAPGGSLVVGELHRFSAWAAWRRIKGWLGSMTWREVHFWTKGELVGLVEGAGLLVEQVRGAVHFPPVAFAARATRHVDPLLGAGRTPGAAFVAIAATKPGTSR